MTPSWMHSRAPLLLAAAALAALRAPAARAPLRAFGDLCRPRQPCWPTAAEWASLNVSVGGRLAAPAPTGIYAAAAHAQYPNQNCHGPLGTFCADASTYAFPAFALDAHTPEDVQLAVSFCAKHSIRVSVRTSGHSFLGTSTAADSLLVYVGSAVNHWMRLEEQFDDGCGGPKVPAVVTGPGVNDGDVYDFVTPRGYLTTAGHALTVSLNGGYLQGGGLGDMTPLLGLAVDNVLSLDVVTPDGKLRHVTRCAEPDLWWALRGGGGGTYGVVVGAAHRLHKAPSVVFECNIAWGGTDALAEEFVEQALRIVPAMAALKTGSFGGGMAPTGYPKSPASYFYLVYLGEDYSEGIGVLQPLFQWLEEHATNPPRGGVVSLKNHSSYFDYHGNNTDPVGFATIQTGRLIPPESFVGAGAKAFAQHIVQERVAKGVPFSAQYHVPQGRFMDPEGSSAVAKHMRRALWNTQQVSGVSPAISAPDWTAQNTTLERAHALLEAATPGSGCYLNECSYWQDDWQQAQWGENYPRLLELKRRYDPQGLFLCHHCVGSEGLA